MMVSDSSDSMLAGIGRFIAPVFAPLGFGNWISSTALLTGLSAKEAVVSTLAVLTNVPDTAQLSTGPGLAVYAAFRGVLPDVYAAVHALLCRGGGRQAGARAARAMRRWPCSPSAAWRGLWPSGLSDRGMDSGGVTHGALDVLLFAAACARRMGRLPRDAPAKAEGLLRQLQRLRGMQKTAMTNPGGLKKVLQPLFFCKLRIDQRGRGMLY